jgi:methyl-accepting chemotaxis protein
VAELVGEIAAASNEQAQGVEQVNTAVTEMDKVTQQNAAGAEESSSASQEMNTQAGQMKRIVGELVAMVDANGNGAKSELSAVIETSKPENNKFIAVRPSGKKTNTGQTAAHQAKEVSPEQLIPLEDGEFKDF